MKLPRWLPRWWRALPLKLPRESSRKRSCDYAQGMFGEPGILLGGSERARRFSSGSISIDSCDHHNRPECKRKLKGFSASHKYPFHYKTDFGSFWVALFESPNSDSAVIWDLILRNGIPSSGPGPEREPDAVWPPRCNKMLTSRCQVSYDSHKAAGLNA